MKSYLLRQSLLLQRCDNTTVAIDATRLTLMLPVSCCVQGDWQPRPSTKSVFVLVMVTAVFSIPLLLLVCGNSAPIATARPGGAQQHRQRSSGASPVGSDGGITIPPRPHARHRGPGSQP